MAGVIRILVGSETGNSEDCADDLVQAISAGGWSAEAVNMDEYEAEGLASEALALVVTSTTGNGSPPYNAEQLLAHLQAGPDLSGLRFGVCGLGDQTYPRFAQCGIDFDRLLEEAGATRVIPLQLCDADYEDEFEAFQDSVLRWLETSAADTFARGASAPASTAAPRAQNFVEARLRLRRRLSGAGSKKETMHYELDLQGASVEFEPGDSFAVSPLNDPAEVAAILAKLELDGAAQVSLEARAQALSEALLERDLQVITLELAELLASIEGPAARARREGEEAFKVWRQSRYLVEALAEQPAPLLSPQRLVEVLRPLQPRLYSVANSPLQDPSSVHFTVETLRWSQGGFRRQGVATTWLCDRLEIGAPVRLRRVRGSHFRLPEEGSRDIICVGPGTGVAPFRAFLQHRAARGDSGRTWLFFGHQTRAADCLYGDEMADFVTRGTLTSWTCAWSRDQPEKVYVQDRMRAHARELWSWLESGALVYVCGDKLRMAGDVRACLVEIAAAQGQMSEADAEAWVAGLEERGRYRLDVY